MMVDGKMRNALRWHHQWPLSAIRAFSPPLRLAFMAYW
jgi:hypothetical protein